MFPRRCSRTIRGAPTHVLCARCRKSNDGCERYFCSGRLGCRRCSELFRVTMTVSGLRILISVSFNELRFPCRLAKGTERGCERCVHGGLKSVTRCLMGRRSVRELRIVSSRGL